MDGAVHEYSGLPVVSTFMTGAKLPPDSAVLIVPGRNVRCRSSGATGRNRLHFQGVESGCC
jgi:hypothetical protein